MREAAALLSLLSLLSPAAATSVHFPHCVHSRTPVPDGVVHFHGIPLRADTAWEYVAHLWYDVQIVPYGSNFKQQEGPSWLVAAASVFGPACAFSADLGAVTCWSSPYTAETTLHLVNSEGEGSAVCVKQFASWRPAAVALGLFLLVVAPIVATSTVFHYLLGAAFLITILLVFVWRNPRKVGSAAALAAAFGYMRPSLMVDHGFWMTYGLTAVVGVGTVLGFLAVYLWQPTENERLCNVVQWTLQLAGLGLIVVQGTSEPVTRPFAAAAFSFAVAFYVAFGDYLPAFMSPFSPLSFCRRALLGLPRRRLLTRKEYHEQMVEATQRGLATLRQHVQQNYSQYVYKLSKNSVRSVHDWTFYGDAPDDDQFGRQPTFAIAEDGSRIDAQDDMETEAQFEAWVANHESQW